MRKLIIFITLFLFMVSCKKLEFEDFFYPQDPYIIVQKTANINVKVSLEKQDSIAGLEDIFKNRAADKCFALVSRDILNSRPLLKGSSSPAPDPHSEFNRFKGQINPVEDQLRQDLVQDFHCSLKVSPHLSLAGEIAGLEGERTIAARGDHISLVLFDEYPDELPVYFVIGRRTSEHGVNLISIFGTGRINQILSRTRPKEADWERGKALARGIILEANHEVEKNDLIFMARMNLRALKVQRVPEDMPVSPAHDETWADPELKRTGKLLGG